MLPKTRKTLERICFLVCCGVLAIFLEIQQRELNASQALTPDNAYYQVQVGCQSERSGQINGAIVFIGDSQVARFATSNVAPKTENFGIGGDTIEGLTVSVRRYQLAGARAVVLETGINNWWTPTRFRNFGKKYDALLDALPASVPVVATSIAPINTSAKKAYREGASVGISGANEQILASCKKHQNCTYLDINTLLADNHGLLVPSFGQSDGLHLTAQGYQIWTAALRKVLPHPGSAPDAAKDLSFTVSP